MASGSSESDEANRSSLAIRSRFDGIDDRSFLEHQAELGRELLEVIGLILGELVEPIEHALDQRGADPPDDRVVLQGLARDVQRQVLGIDESAEEPEVIGKQLAAVALHQDPAGAEVHAMLEPGKAESFQVRGRTVEHGVELDGRVDRQVQVPERRLFGVVRQVLVKPGVLLLGHLVLGLDPDGFLIVEDLAGDQPDGVRDEARIAPDDLLDASGSRQVLGVFLEMEDDLGPAGQGAFHWRDREAAGSVRFPQPARLLAIATRAHLDPVGDHERRIEPDSELPDQREVGLLPGIAREGLEKLARPAVGNRSQVGHQLIVGHADAVIPDDQLALRLSRVDHDLERARFAVGFLGERNVAHLVERIRCVGNQLADRDLAALVKGVRKEMEKLLDLGLECELLCFSRGCHRRHSHGRRSVRQRRSG